MSCIYCFSVYPRETSEPNGARRQLLIRDDMKLSGQFTIPYPDEAPEMRRNCLTAAVYTQLYHMHTRIVSTASLHYTFAF